MVLYASSARMVVTNSVRAEQPQKMQDIEIKEYSATLPGDHRSGRVRSVIDLSAAKGYPTLLFAPHFYTIALETI